MALDERKMHLPHSITAGSMILCMAAKRGTRHILFCIPKRDQIRILLISVMHAA
jgi:hypothetical protein